MVAEQVHDGPLIAVCSVLCVYGDPSDRDCAFRTYNLRVFWWVWCVNVSPCMHASDFLRLAPSASTAKTEDEMTNLVAAIRSVIRNSGTRQNFCIVSTSDEGLRGQISVLVCCFTVKSERTNPHLCVYINTQFINCCRGAGTILPKLSTHVFFSGSLYLLKVSATKFVLSKNGQSHSLTDPNAHSIELSGWQIGEKTSSIWVCHSWCIMSYGLCVW